jgi:hypothetical protein
MAALTPAHLRVAGEGEAAMAGWKGREDAHHTMSTEEDERTSKTFNVVLRKLSLFPR